MKLSLSMLSLIRTLINPNNKYDDTDILDMLDLCSAVISCFKSILFTYVPKLYSDWKYFIFALNKNVPEHKIWKRKKKEICLLLVIALKRSKFTRSHLLHNDLRQYFPIFSP